MAAGGDAERLVILLEARIKDFEKNMAKAAGTADRQYDRMRRDSRSATKAMETDMVRSTNRINQALAASSAKIGAYGKAAIGGEVALGITGIVREVGEVAKSVATVGDEAKRAGVSAKAFQEWKFVAEQNRIGLDAMVDGLKELNLRADEFVATGKGSAAEAFQRLGYGAEELGRKLTDPSALLLEIIGRLGEMDRAAQIRIADELFGGSAGERFVELISQGEAGIRSTIDRAHELGVVMSDDLIDKAAELDRRFGEVAATVGTGLKSAIVSAADSLADFIEGFKAFEDQRSGSLETRQGELMRERGAVGAELRELEGVPATAANRNANRRRAILEQRMAALDAEENEIIAILSQRTSAQGWKPAGGTWTPPTPPAGGFGSTSTTAERDKAKDVLDDLKAQQEQLGRTAREQAVYNALQRAAVDLNTEAGTAIAEAAGSLYDQELALSQNIEAMDVLRDASRDVLGSFVEGMRDGKSATESLGDALQGLADRLLNSGLDGLISGILGGGGTAGGGLLSNVFGGARARGGPVDSGKSYLVGEKGPELFTPKRSGNITPNGGGGSVVYSPNYQITVGGGSDARETADQIKAVLRQYDRDLGERLPALVQRAERNRRLHK